jgi:dTMP kinase
MGLFISFEGGEGCGKTTQAKRLAAHLKQAGYRVVRTHEPGGTTLGNDLRRSLKKCRDALVIIPALEQDSIVICDRFTDSTVAYQGYGRGLPLDLVETINSVATRELRPDLIVLLDMDPALALKRKRQPRDRFELEGLVFHERVRQGYHRLAAEEPQRWLVLDATRSPGTTAQSILERVQTLLEERSSGQRPA